MRLSTIVTRLASASLLGAFAFGLGGVGTASAASASSTTLRSSINIVSTPVSAAQISPGSSFTDTFVVSNLGNESADNVTLQMSFDPAVVQLQGVQFSRANAWVTTTMANGFRANLGSVGSSGDAVTVSTKFVALAGYPAGMPLQAQLEAAWRDTSNHRSDFANLPMVAVEAGQSTTEPNASVTSGSVNLTAGGFNPGEAIAFWYNLPNGTAAPLYVRHGQLVTDRTHEERTSGGARQDVDNSQSLFADTTGHVSSAFAIAGRPAGSYSIVAHGLNSGITVVIPFNL